MRMLHELGCTFALNRTRYNEVDICRADFEATMSERHAKSLGFWGVLVMAFGFMLLAAYHGLEIANH